MTRPTVALAAWVKTPGRTPAKTRLAAAIGTAGAEAFHAHCVEALREILHEAAQRSRGAIVPWWAVAEDDATADPCWRDHAVVAQGGGGLGERLARVHDALAARHAAVIFVGADAPHVDPALLLHAADSLLAIDGPDWLLAPAEDGGFWLWGGRRALPASVWTGVTYSAPTTMAELRERLACHGTGAELPTDFDVDTVEELRRLRATLDARGTAGPARARLHAWLREHCP